MMRFFKDKHGAVNVFLVIILVPVLIISCFFVDVSRGKMAGSLVSSAGDLTLNTMLTQFDPVLNDYYGLLASCQDMDEFMATANDYFTACISSQGVESDESRKYANMITDMLQGDGGEIADLLQLNATEDGQFKVSVAENGTLNNPALVKKEIVEFMKYRAPADMVSDLIDKFRASAQNLENAQNDTELTEKKKEFYETQGDLIEQAKKVYDAMLEYNDFDITAGDIQEMQKYIEGAKESYKKFHTKMVMDLYNTQDINFQESTINLKYTASKDSVKKKQINGYINNAAKSMQEFLEATKALDNANNTGLPAYEEGKVYDIQYLVACVEILNQNSSYKEYAKKANTLVQNMSKLSVAMELCDEEEKEKMYTLASYDSVSTSGEATRQQHYDDLNQQYTEIKDNYLEDPYAPYNVLTDRLSWIQSHYRNDMDPTDTNNEIQKLYSNLNGYYTKYDQANGQLSKVKDELNKLSEVAEKYRNKYNEMQDKANSYGDTTLKQADKEENAEEEKKNKEILEKVTPENVQAMISRINNVESLLSSVKEVIDGYTYNDYPIRNIADYNTMREKSGVDASRITYIKSELEQYAQDSFKFKTSDKSIHITKDNNPAIAEINTPALYKWMDKYFEDCKKENENKPCDKKEAEKKKDKEKNQYNIDGIKKYGNYLMGNSNEIKDQSNLPSAGEGVKLADVEVENNLKKMSEFVSSLFKDFSGTVNRSLVSARDDLYTIDYVMNMFSYDTFENEGKFKLCGDPEKYDDSNVKKEWASEKLTYSDNKTLTNKMINADNNFAYGGEVEYILYGGSNAKNIASAYGTIFAIRYVLNLPADFSKHWNNPALITTAAEIQTASYGMIPAPLTKLVIILGLTAAESAKDLMYLQKGVPLKLVKTKNDIEITYPQVLNFSLKKKKESADAFYYSDYLKLILFLKLAGNEEYKIYSRIADVIQVNMDQKISSSFVMAKADVYYKATAKLTVEPLMLKLPIVTNAGYAVPGNGGWNTITYEAVRGY